MAISWIIELTCEDGEEWYGPFRTPFEANSARGDCEGPTLLYVATEDRRTVCEINDRGVARALGGDEVREAIKTLEYLERVKSWSSPEWSSNPST